MLAASAKEARQMRWLVISTALALAGPALAAPDAARGQRLAESFCANCHVLAPQGGASWTDAPTFSALARDPKITRAWFRQFVQQPHLHMMGTNRSQAEADDLAAFIASLRR